MLQICTCTKPKLTFYGHAVCTTDGQTDGRTDELILIPIKLPGVCRCRFTRYLGIISYMFIARNDRDANAESRCSVEM